MEQQARLPGGSEGSGKSMRVLFASVPLSDQPVYYNGIVKLVASMLLEGIHHRDG